MSQLPRIYGISLQHSELFGSDDSNWIRGNFWVWTDESAVLSDSFALAGHGNIIATDARNLVWQLLTNPEFLKKLVKHGNNRNKEFGHGNFSDRNIHITEDTSKLSVAIFFSKLESSLDGDF
jgi:hypothetical protein